MKKIIFVILLCFLFFFCSCENQNTTSFTETTPQSSENTTEIETEPQTQFEFQDNDYYPAKWVRWGMALKEVADKDDRIDDDDAGYELNDTVRCLEVGEFGEGIFIYDEVKDYDYKFNCYYAFVENKLKAYWIVFEYEDTLENNNCLETYELAKSALIKKYGKPESEKYIWNDDTYKNDKSQYESAFQYGYFVIQTKFKSKDDTAIYINWEFDNMIISYCKLGFENSLFTIH